MADRILIVDDDDTLGESLELLLSSEGCQVVAARDAESALDLAAQHPIDVVLCDARMPGLDGFDLLPQLSRIRPAAPIVLSSTVPSLYGAGDLMADLPLPPPPPPPGLESASAVISSILRRFSLRMMSKTDSITNWTLFVSVAHVACA